MNKNSPNVPPLSEKNNAPRANRPPGRPAVPTEENVKQLIEMMPNDDKKYEMAKMLADMFYQQENYTQAAVYYEKALEADPHQRRIYSALASCALMQDDLSTGRQRINEGIEQLKQDYKEILPDQPPAHLEELRCDIKSFYNLRGYFNFRLKNYSKAIRDYQVALNKGTSHQGKMNDDIYFGLGMCYANTNNLTAAQSSLKKCLAHNPSHAFAAQELERLTARAAAAEQTLG